MIMNAKILSLLLVFFLGISFTSCSKDDDNDASYESGVAEGKKFNEAYADYKAASGFNSVVPAATMYSSYQQYKSNSEDKDWKEGFIAGATNFDESKYSEFANIFDTENIASADNLIALLTTLLG